MYAYDLTDSSTCGVDIPTDETSRGNNLKNVGSRRSTPSKNIEYGFPYKDSELFVRPFLCWALCRDVCSSSMLSRGAGGMQADGRSRAGRGGMPRA
jgi:hypothetical protein